MGSNDMNMTPMELGFVQYIWNIIQWHYRNFFKWKWDTKKSPKSIFVAMNNFIWTQNFIAWNNEL
jgi:hypothetical protein